MRSDMLLFIAFAAVFACTENAVEPGSATGLLPSFGVEPSPFAPINQLREVEDHLVQIGDRFDQVFSETGPNDEHGVVDQLGAMALQLGEQNEKVVRALNLDAPDMPQVDLETALVGVQGEANSILAKAQEKMGVEPSPFSPVILEGIGGVAGGAQEIILTVQNYTGPVCSDNPCDPNPGCCIPCTGLAGQVCCAEGCPAAASCAG